MAKASKMTEYGVQQALESLNALDEKGRKTLLTNLRKLDPEIAAALENKLFEFHHLQFANPLGLQELFKQIDDNDLCMALRGSSQDFIKQIFKNFSQRRVIILSDIIKDMGPQPMSKVSDAREKIMSKARELKELGKIVISNNKETV